MLRNIDMIVLLYDGKYEASKQFRMGDSLLQRNTSYLPNSSRERSFLCCPLCSESAQKTERGSTLLIRKRALCVARLPLINIQFFSEKGWINNNEFSLFHLKKLRYHTFVVRSEFIERTHHRTSTRCCNVQYVIWGLIGEPI